MKTLRVLLAVAVVFASFAFVPVPKVADAVVGWIGAGGSPYIGNANPQPLDINVSRDNRFSTNRFDRYFDLDSQGRPHIVWTDRTSDTINYVYWNGTNWSIAGGTVYNPATSNARISIGGGDVPQLVLDSKDRPHITWHGNGPVGLDIFYIWWNGSNWVNANGILYSGANGDVSNDSDSSTDPNLAVDSKDLPHIVWFNDSDREIYYIRFNGSNWVVQDNSIYNPATGNANISKNAGESNYPQIDLDSADIPGIVWDDDSGGNLDTFFVKLYPNQTYTANGSIYNGTNANVSNDSFSGIGQGAEIKFDNQNYPWVLWHANGDVYCVKWNGTNWATINGSLYVPNSGNANITQNSGTSDCSTITFDSSNYPHFAWHDTTYGNQEICYMKWNGTSFVNANNVAYSPTIGNVNISSNTGSSYNPHLVLDSAGLPHLLWTDNTIGNSEIYYAHFSNSYDGSFTLTKSVDTNNDGDYNDSGKQVNVGDTLKYKINWKFNQGQDPLEEPYLYDTIPEGTHYVAGSASPNANLSYSLDGGTTWIAGEPPNGSPAGTQLRWDLSSLWVGAAGSPYIGSAVTQPMDINVSRMITPSGYYDASMGQLSERIKIDKKGFPNIIWDENVSGNWEICFVKWNGNNWVNIQGVIYNPTLNNANISQTTLMSIEPEFTLDDNDYPNICWSEGSTTITTDVWFVRWNGTDLVNVDNSIYNPLTNSANVSNNSGWSMFSTIRLDKNNQPNIAWDDQSFSNRRVLFVKWDGSNWRNIQGTIYNSITGNATVGDPAMDPSLELDINDNPHLAWDAFGSLYLVHWDGSNWMTVDNLTFNPGTGNARIPSQDFRNSPIIRIGKDGYPRLFLMHLIGNSEMCFIRWDGVKWVNINGITYNPVTNNHNISNDSKDSWPGTLELDKNDNPHLTWLNTTPGNPHSDSNDIVYVYWDGNQLATGNETAYNPALMNANIDKNVGLSKYPSMTLDSNDNPHFTWFDNTLGNDEVFYITKANNNRNMEFSVQVDNPPTAPAFCNEATFRHKWDNGKATLSNTVCNTIDYNFTGTFELKKSVETTGDDKYDDDGKEAKAGDRLNYKIDWSFDNPNSDPLFDAYVYDTIPEGTTYVAGSATTDMLSHSTDGGSTWIAGEPPDGAAAGTRLRWKTPQPGWTNAKGLIVNSTNPNVSKNTGISDFPSLQLDPITKYPCIAWSDDVSGTTLVYFTKWNGNQWTNAAGLPFTIANGNVGNIPGGDPTLTLDPLTGYPWIAFQSNAILFSNLEIHIVKWNGTQWTNAAGMPVTLLNSNVSNNAGLSWYPSHQLALDSNRYPCFVWKDNSSGSWQSYFARWNGLNWVNVPGAILNATNGSLGNNIVDPSFWPTLVLDSNDNPCIAWDSNITGNSEIYFAKWNGASWVNINGLPLTPTNGNVSNNTGSSLIPYLAIDKLTNYPGIVWSDNTPGNYEIYYAKWNGSTWVNSSGSNLTATNGNISNNPGNSSLLSMVYNSNNQPYVSWEDDTPGNSEIFFARWNGTNWVNALGSGFTTSNGLVNTSPGRSWFPSIALDKQTGNPSIVWLDKTPGNNEVYFAKWTDFKKTFNFSVKLDNPFEDYSLSPICNKAEFWHVFDKGNHIKSNSVCNNVYVDKEYIKSLFEVIKTSQKYTYYETDTISFVITVANKGKNDILGVNLVDSFPRELEFISSLPQGSTGNGSVKFVIGKLKSGEKRRFELKFKLAKNINISENGLYLTNNAKATSASSWIESNDSATVFVARHVPIEKIKMSVLWIGINTKTSVANKGTEISAKITPEGGSSPYQITIDWGDGSDKSRKSDVTTDKPPTLTHTYNEAGEYTITIICTDQYGNVCKIIRKVKVE